MGSCCSKEARNVSVAHSALHPTQNPGSERDEMAPCPPATNDAAAEPPPSSIPSLLDTPRLESRGTPDLTAIADSSESDVPDSPEPEIMPDNPEPSMTRNTLELTPEPTSSPAGGENSWGGLMETTQISTPVDGLELPSLSIKWVLRSCASSNKGAVVVNPEAAVATDSFPSKPLNFIMIFGPSKSGKSFIMNALARRDGIFTVSPAASPCTSGVDLSKTVVSLQDFVGTTTGGDSEGAPCIGFVDVEGLGDRDPSHHVKLAIPPMLVSKVIIFNLKDIQRTTTLDTLAVLQSAAKAVAPVESQGVYGHLIVLVRDTYDKADDVNRLLFGEEEADEDASYDDVTALEMRNLSREKLKRIFKEIKVWCLPQPHSDINDNKTFVLSDLKPEFHAKLDELRLFMSGVLASPHTFGGSNISGGRTLQPLVEALCAAVSECKAVKPLSMMESIELQTAESLCTTGARTFMDVLNNFDASEMWVVEEMEESLRHAREAALAEFNDWTKDLQTQARETARQKFKSWIDNKAHDFRTAMEIDRTKMNRSVGLLNQQAFAQLQREAASIELPIDNFNAVWIELCDDVFVNLQAVVAHKLGDLLPHVATVLSHMGFRQATQGMYQSFDERNSLEKQVRQAKMDREGANEALKSILAREAQQRHALERTLKDQAAKHSNHLAHLQDSLWRVESGASRMAVSLEEQRLEYQKRLQDQEERHQAQMEECIRQQRQPQQVVHSFGGVGQHGTYGYAACAPLVSCDGRATRPLTSWQEFQKANAGQGLKPAQMATKYHASGKGKQASGRRCKR